MSEVLVRCENVGKKFCRDLKSSLWYGVKDSLTDLFRRNQPAMAANTEPAGDAINKLRAGEFWANRNVSFELKRGQCLGLIGRNGAGKTTLLKMLSGLIKPDTGRIEVHGRTGALIALGAGFNPVLTGRENVFVNGSVLGVTKREMQRKLDEIVQFAEIEEFIDSPVRTYSSGMQVRLGFAIASTLEPDVLIIDEVLAVGDVGFRTKCYNRIFKLRNKASLIFVSHTMSHVDRLCSHAMVLHSGQCHFLGETNLAIDKYNTLFTSQAKPEQVAPGVEVHSVRFNGMENPQITTLSGADALTISMVTSLPSRVQELEVTVSFLDMSLDLISQASSRFVPSKLVTAKNPHVIKVHIPAINMGSGKRLLSIALVSSLTNEILYWGHGSWEMNVMNKVFVPTPSMLSAEFSLETAPG
ncbi:MAG TPA: ABC transporter [Planctomycetaceae bacterium]|nr:ABC transporter [Planctomycetaceae bacterium]